MRERLIRFSNLLLDVSAADPDDARRRKLLNVILIGTGSLNFLVLITLLSISIIGRQSVLDGMRGPGPLDYFWEYSYLPGVIEGHLFLAGRYLAPFWFFY